MNNKPTKSPSMMKVAQLKEYAFLLISVLCTPTNASQAPVSHDLVRRIDTVGDQKGVVVIGDFVDTDFLDKKVHSVRYSDEGTIVEFTL